MAGEISRFQPPWTDGLLEELHATLLGGLGLRDTPGVFRSEPYQARVSTGGVLYYACPPEQIRPELQGLLEWVDHVGPTLMPVIPASLLFQGLLSIRPFPVGNTTVARTVATLYLRQHGLPNAELAPISASALATPDVLSRVLLWSEATGSYTELVDYMIDSALGAYATGTERWLGAGRSSSPIDEVGVRLLSKARRLPGWFSASEATSWVAGRSGPTVHRHLNQLVRSGLIESLGRTRAKRYRLVSPRAMVPELRRRLEAGGSGRRSSLPRARRPPTERPSASPRARRRSA